MGLRRELARPPSAALLFATGVAWNGPAPGTGVAALWLIAGALALAWWRPRAVAAPALALAAGLVGAGMLVAAWRTPSPWPAGAAAPPLAPQSLEGVVTRSAEWHSSGLWELRLQAPPHLVRVRATTAARAGDRVRVVGRLRPLRGERNFTGVDRAAAARAEGLTAELTAERLEVLGRSASPSSMAWRGVGALRQRWLAAMTAAGGRDERYAVLRGVTLGARDGISEELGRRWRAVGVYHALSVSGLHLAVVALLAFAVLRRLAAAVPGVRDPARLAFWPAAALALGYTLLTGAEIATLRALVAALLWMVGAALGRPLRLLDALGAAALLLLAWAPAQLWQPSFQLSFAAAVTLALQRRSVPSTSAGGRLARLLRALARWAARGVVSSAWVVVVTSAITAYHFQQVQPGGVVGNLLVTPLLELGALPLGLAGLGVWELSAAAGEALWAAAAALVGAADAVAGPLAAVCPVGEVGIASPAVAVAMAAVAAAMCGLSAERRWCYVGCLVLVALWWRAPLAAPDGVRVTFFDVGQGDAALVETRSELWLIDAGGQPGAASVAAAASPARAIREHLTLLRRDRLDVVVISHPHPDHYLGLWALVSPPDGVAPVHIDELWLADGALEDGTSARWGPRRAALPTFAELVLALERAGTSVRRLPPQGRASAGARLDVVAPRFRPEPSASVRLAADPVRTVNDNSVVAVLQYGGRRVLFTGDLELEGEEVLAEEVSSAIRADVVKVPHHGSRTSSSQRLVAAAGAGLVIISCGAGNRFGFPAPEVLERWQAADATVLRTDRGGAVRLEISSAGELTVHRP